MQDIKNEVRQMQSKLIEVEKALDINTKKEKLALLEAKTTDPDFWNDQISAKKLMQEIGGIKDEITNLENLKKDLYGLDDLLDDPSLSKDVEKEVKLIKENLTQLTLTSFLSDPYDIRNAMISIHAGQGGTEAMDWASMLYRMYLRYCEKREFSTEVIDITEGEEAGIKSITFKVVGVYAYGYLKGEAGTHRLVRQSPFNADNLRQTSFALVGVLPELEDVDLPDIKIKDEDLEWQFFRSSSQGGQNVQKVSTAVRVKHIPTGITVSAQSERFQEQNRKNALNLLRGKLWLLEEERKKTEVKNIQGEYRPASWGNQIRSYVLHPYKMVKDLRTKVETSDTEGVLNGEIDTFIESELSLGKKDK